MALLRCLLARCHSVGSYSTMSLPYSPRDCLVLSLCGWLRRAVWAAAVRAAANDQQSKASVMCCTMSTIQLPPDYSGHRYQLL